MKLHCNENLIRIETYPFNQKINWKDQLQEYNDFLH